MNIRILNMAPVLAQMHGNAIGTAEMGFDGSPKRVGLIGTPSLAKRGDVVDIDAEFDHNSCNSIFIGRQGP
jgi:hypothetical protein